MPGTVIELFPQWHTASLGMTHNESTPPLTTHKHHYSSSPLFYQRSSIHPSVSTPGFSSSPSSAALISPSFPLSNPPSHCAIFLLLHCFFPPSFPPSHSCLAALSIILLLHPGWPTNSHFLFSPSCLFCSPLCHPLTPIPSSAVLSPAFRLEIGSGKQPTLG